MKAISRLEISGLTLPQIAKGAGVGQHAVRRWKRGECTPSEPKRRQLTEFANGRGVLLLASDFNKNDH
jgi:transcriptional regulator with XRE-family HTH domain